MELAVSAMERHHLAAPFKEPVSMEEVPDYLTVVRNPIGALRALMFRLYPARTTPDPCATRTVTQTCP